jgi:L-seryl-tRNA(Ser) seleniumtransferase
MPSDKKDAFRNLPSVDEVLRTETGLTIAESAGAKHAAQIARNVVETLRRRLASSTSDPWKREELLNAAVDALRAAWSAEELSGIHRVINATGVVIHTNLGRAPLSDTAVEALRRSAGYCSLEYDVSTGKRGRRGERAEDLIKQITGAEDALIVNNCAAADFFVLNVFASGGEVVISRGELVEIGGDFRVPDVLAASGTTLREVGTTNRTKLTDYARALTRQTKMILRVHPSNYRIVGFTAIPSLKELADLAHARNVVLFEDLGSGALIELAINETTVGSSIKAGADVVTFSGDKLLGATQAGVIAGKRKIISKLRSHPLYRALRTDKLTYAALEATLSSYARGTAKIEVPVVMMLSATRAQIKRRANVLVRQIKSSSGFTDLRLEILNGVSATGGGAAPGVELETALIAISHQTKSAAKLERELRLADPAVIARIVDDRVVIDLRTVSTREEDDLANSIRALA